ncbi:hypothetical protein BDP55DRAFT_628926 [Colletotrichum godetiae]|uniref:Secreted protein n=1 Tax=Colletotrichum godetiae TaxID=1209918 RepID=A0AAJ0F1K3_9PEZI|nr:uncharacterized protein BDP55DRAFT_628926 [Colletotrichum godetiae]KAK1689623.1 hypothetical protein BDP55DRAFT_628926 [Colletotrichum godetiae]
MLTIVSLLWAFATVFGIALASPTNVVEVDLPKTAKPAAPIKTYTFTQEDIDAYVEKNGGAGMLGMNELTLSDLNDPPVYNITCPDKWQVYYYNWWPLLNKMCGTIDNMGGGWADGPWTGVFGGNQGRIDRARKVTFDWVDTGGNCEGSCVQVFSILRNAGPCRGEEFWMKEKISMNYQGCGIAKFTYLYQEQPVLEHGRGECWNAKDERPTYLPTNAIVKDFCDNTIATIRGKGAAQFVKDVYELGKDGHYFTSYNRQVDDPRNRTRLYDVGMIHFWIKPKNDTIACPVGKTVQSIVEDETSGLTPQLCQQRILAIQNMNCGAPLGKSEGGRLWADCFEWGIEPSGYNGIEIMG